jgi:Common central domain of tyrosinase
MTIYAAFQNAVESGTGLTSGNRMHNGMHGWIGGPGQMSFPAFSPFDPFFYLHHCNIDRIWAMWQADGHADEYPTSGGRAYHNRNDMMYPWVGSTAGFGTNSTVAASIPMPDVAAVGIKRNVDTLDMRAYCPDHKAAGPAQAGQDHAAAGEHDHGSPGGPGPGMDLIPPGCDAGCPLEQFTRILSASAAVID